MFRILVGIVFVFVSLFVPKSSDDVPGLNKKEHSDLSQAAEYSNKDNHKKLYH